MGNSKAVTISLWVLQVLLALFLGLASGLPKLIFSPESDVLAGNMPIPLAEPFLRFIGIAEIAGALGLVLPGLFHIRPGLTPLAALGLVLLTICAAVYQLMAGQPGSAIFAAVISLLCAIVAYGRWKVAPHGRATGQPVVAPVS